MALPRDGITPTSYIRLGACCFAKGIMYEHREEGRQAGRQQRRFLVAFSDQTSFFLSMTVAYSDSHPALYVVHGRAKPVFRGQPSIGSTD